MATLGEFKLAGARATYSVEQDEPALGGRVTLFVQPHPGTPRYQVLAAPDLQALLLELRGILEGVQGVSWTLHVTGKGA